MSFASTFEDFSSIEVISLFVLRYRQRGLVLPSRDLIVLKNWLTLVKGDEDLLSEIGRTAAICGEAVSSGSWDKALSASAEEWLLRKKLWPNIETSLTREIAKAAEKHGALFSRVCGAGGGGVMAIFSPPEQKEIIEAELLRKKLHVLPSLATTKGLSVTLN